MNILRPIQLVVAGSLLVASAMTLVGPSTVAAEGRRPLRDWLEQHRQAGRGTSVPAPDYARHESWAALPDMRDAADLTPPGETDRQAVALADVFYIHPTTYFGRQPWNAPADQGDGSSRGVDVAIREQASAFNDCCRVFAPRYRQATVFAFARPDDPRSVAALDLAYGDVERAFAFFITHLNQGRPFIIAGHSQGSLHAMRLVQARIAGTPLARRLVAVYMIGSPAPKSLLAQTIPDCASATQTGCLIDWNTVSNDRVNRTRDGTTLIWDHGRYEQIGNRPLLCVNPLDWRIDGAAPQSANLGALPPGQPSSSALPALLPALTGTVCESHLLVVDLPKGSPFHTSLLLGPGNDHLYDYNLFYLNLRRNASTRVNALLGR